MLMSHLFPQGDVELPGDPGHGQPEGRLHLSVGVPRVKQAAWVAGWRGWEVRGWEARGLGVSKMTKCKIMRVSPKLRVDWDLQMRERWHMRQMRWMPSPTPIPVVVAANFTTES